MKKAPASVQKASKPDMILVHYFDGWADVHNTPSMCVGCLFASASGVRACGVICRLRLLLSSISASENRRSLECAYREWNMTHLVLAEQVGIRVAASIQDQRFRGGVPGAREI